MADRVPQEAVEAAVKQRIDRRYGRSQWESWGLDKRAEITGFVRAEVEQAYQVLGDPVQAIREAVLVGVAEALLDVDGPVLMAVRDAVGEEIGGDEDWRYDGEEPHPNDPCVEEVCSAASNGARKALAAALTTLKEERPVPPNWECCNCGKTAAAGTVFWHDFENADEGHMCPECSEWTSTQKAALWLIHGGLKADAYLFIALAAGPTADRETLLGAYEAVGLEPPPGAASTSPEEGPTDGAGECERTELQKWQVERLADDKREES